MNNIKINKNIVDKFPFLIPRNIYTDEIIDDYDYSYTLLDNIPTGWINLVLDLCEELRSILIKHKCLNSFRIIDIKDKYNTLRVYYSGVPHCLDNLITNTIIRYEKSSYDKCMICGNFASYHSDYQNLCKNCFNKKYKERVVN